MGLSKEEKAQSTFENSVDVEPVGIDPKEGYKYVWIEKHRFWVEVPITEPDEIAIERVTKKFNNRTNFTENEQSKSKSI